MSGKTARRTSFQTGKRLALLLLLPGCARWSATMPRPAASPPLPPPEASPESGGEERSRPPAALSDQEVLGAAVLDAGGERRGTIADVLAADDGTIVAVLVRDEGGLSSAASGDLRRHGAGWVLRGPDGGRKAEPRDEELFADRESVKVRGSLVELDFEPGRPAELKLHETKPNLVHRVRVDAAPLVLRALPELELGARLEIEGVLTRDAVGKLVIASVVAAGGRELTLRGPEGAVLWDELGTGWVSVRGLRGESVETGEGSRVAVLGCTFDWTQGVLSALVVEAADGPCAVEWEHVRRGPEGLRLEAGARLSPAGTAARLTPAPGAG